MNQAIAQGKPAIAEKHVERFGRLVVKHNNATLAEIRDMIYHRTRIAIAVSESTISRTVQRLDLPRNKKTLPAYSPEISH